MPELLEIVTAAGALGTFGTVMILVFKMGQWKGEIDSAFKAMAETFHQHDEREAAYRAELTPQLVKITQHEEKVKSLLHRVGRLESL